MPWASIRRHRRPSRDGSYGWNKSSSEGNEESSWLTALMIPATVGYRDAFIARHHYLDIQRFLERGGGWEGGNREALEKRTQLASARAMPAMQEDDDSSLVPRVTISGVLSSDGEFAVLGPLSHQELSQASAPTGGLEVALLDDADRTLASVRVAATGGEAGAPFFRASLPWNARAEKVVVRRDDALLGMRIRSGHTPEARLEVSPKRPASAGVIDVSWSASDADGDALVELFFTARPAEHRGRRSASGSNHPEPFRSSRDGWNRGRSRRCGF